MRIARFNEDRIGIVRDNRVLDVTDQLTERLPSAPYSLARRLITEFATVRPLLEQTASVAGPGDGLPLGQARLLAPVPDPAKIVAAPVNYRAHQSEMNEAYHISSLGFFLKSPSSILDPEGTVRLPYTDRRFDHEAEFALVVGRRASHVTPEQALDHVFGYTGLMDITMRGGEDRSTRKSFDTFTPLGPWLVTPDELGSPEDVDLELTVNGEPRQKANTSELIWSAARFLSYASTVTVLEPGDVLTTGTPAGVAPVEDGDVVELAVARIGRLRVAVSAEGAVPCPTSGASRGPVPPPAPSHK
ncbi:fumarylacetoacetate hydrolase family protein [Streptomyces phaeochromogenes]|uniref:fumarylacetoacetate hydrolase family protein n=1 Tax=Streptomyces phaeochromogenes TaxID=1923 RepID=UPI00386E9AAB|nr:fumarylacetoacetate hydrolase family protein [Streptomyces phaeochromogenes]